MKGAHSISFDSNVLTYFLQANSGTYDPASDDNASLAVERVAAYRLFLYGPTLTIVPSVLQEAQAIPDPVTREEHVRWIYYQLNEVLPANLDENDVLVRQRRYQALHPTGRLDCRAVAEAESAGLERFITFDSRLRRRLAGKTKRIIVQCPTECWRDLREFVMTMDAHGNGTTFRELNIGNATLHPNASVSVGIIRAEDSRIEVHGSSKDRPQDHHRLTTAAHAFFRVLLLGPQRSAEAD